MALVSGTRLGSYQVESQLRAGGMGEVYRAKDTRLGRTVAVKVLPSQFSQNPDLRQRFEREARAISSLSHAHICVSKTDARTDIFAFGTVVQEMATGQPAFAGKSKASLIAAILERDPPPISSLQPLAPPALDHVVKRGLRKDPEERWQTVRDLLHELKWIAESGSAIARRKNRERLPGGSQLQVS